MSRWRFSSELFRKELSRLNRPGKRQIVSRACLDSTSTELIERVKGGALPGTLVVAGSQRMGRGRRGRQWHSPPAGNLYVSLAVSVRGPADKSLGFVPLAAGVAAVDAARRAGAIGAELKWPNDILVHGRKLGGILCEVPELCRRPLIAVVGLGLNTGRTEFPGELEQTAVSLAELSDAACELEITAAAWVAGLESWMDRLEAGDHEGILQAWKDRAEPFGRKVRIDDTIGTTVDLDGQGRLVLCREDGALETISAGTVERI